MRPSKQTLGSSQPEEVQLPELDKLIDLHAKYCQTNEKAIEDLQRDLYCLSDDFYKLELYLQTGRSNYFWTEIEDLVL